MARHMLQILSSVAVTATEVIHTTTIMITVHHPAQILSCGIGSQV